ncbi:uncharacterized protein CTRU02_204350 [Colletotrichum truncatum]|uniref:Uncharacterized protein n=1 Tax=Colletotrichum truncatum TaxID=5467 RepID=A0ACC3ZCE4_COLTU|nr:uncharacterized protein CTRU02_13071 [Colletotrichum truncatum]KAF6783821.1 hypothetical protein CTRU02_13071 [Colletotrichum truncatum]
MFVQQIVLQAFGLIASSLPLSVKALPASHYELHRPSHVTTVHTVPGTATLENLAVRNNGHILVASVTSSTLYQLSPTNEGDPVGVAEIAGVTGLLGISELEPDLFYVIGSNLTSTENSNGVWKVDLRNFEVSRNGTIIQPAKISLVKRIPSARQLNGMTPLAANDTTNLLISDSSLGTIIRLNVVTGDVKTIHQEREMAPLDTGLNIGVNGIRIRGNSLYFVSLDQGLFARLPISLTDGSAAGPVEILASNITFGDDFALSNDGKRAYVATNGPQEVLGVDLTRGGKVVVASSSLLSSASSVALDKLEPEKVFYVTGAAKVGNSTVGHLARVALQCRTTRLVS